MRIVITGGSGFLGHAFIERNSLDAEIISIGRSQPHCNVAHHITLDLSKPGALEEAISRNELPKNIDAVVHLAWSRRHREFPEAALDMFQLHVAAPAVLLDYARRAGARCVVLGSTGTVYDPFPKTTHAEHDVTIPTNYFGMSKLMGEMLASIYSPKYYSIFIPRFFTPYGPGQKGRLIDTLIAQVSEGRPVLIPLRGAGLETAPIYIDDAVALLEKAIRGSWSGIYNIAGPQVLSLRQMAESIGNVVGKEPIIERSGQASSLRLVPDISRLRHLVDMSTFIEFQEGIRRVVERQ